MAQENQGNGRRGVSGWMVAAIWLVSIAVCYAWAGGFLADSVEGIDTSRVSKLPLVIAGLVAAAAIAVTVVWARGIVAAPGSAESAGGAKLGRRRFLAGGATALGGLVASVGAAFGRNLGWITVTAPSMQAEAPFAADNPRPEWKGARVQDYRLLGRTGFRVSDISLGSGRIRGEIGERVAREAIERGVNYFDTAPDYSETGSELALGKAMKGHRDQMFLATKFCTPQGHLPVGSPVETYMEVVNGSLERLQTDYVDLVHVHACDTVERLLDPNVHEAFVKLKQQGKARFLGFSSHTPNLEAVANAAIDDGRFDVMMLAYHHGAWPELASIVDRAAQKQIGVVAMKTLKGAKHRGLLENRDEADSYSQAAFKWVLANPSVSCLVISFRELSNVDEYLFASGKRPSSKDFALLEKYDGLIAGKHCYPHCGACLNACPAGVPIDDVLRYRMYFEDYGEQKQAMRLYARLDTQVDRCSGCHMPCAGTCPHGVSIPTRVRGAHRMLTLA
jgi:predicted aldo/keto reductase-like oxidoreductase